MKKNRNDSAPTVNCAPARLPAAFQASSALMLMVDPETALIVDANQAASEFYGYPQDELRGSSAAAVSLRPTEQVVELLRALKCGGGGRFVSRHRLKNGTLCDMELESSNAVLEDGREVLLFVGHDITPLVNAQRALREREGLLKAILDSAGEGIGFKDTEHIYREANPAFCAMLGSACENVLGRTSANFFPPEFDAQNRASDLQVVESRTSMVYETFYPSKDGLRQVSVHKSPVLDADGDPLGVVFISRDITDERRASEALKKSEGLLRAMLNSARDCIFVLDPDGVFSLVNVAFCELLGKAEEDILGRSMDEVFESTELHMQRSTHTLTSTTRQPVHFSQRIQRAQPGPSAGIATARHKDAGGKARPTGDVWMSLVKTPIEDESGELLGVLGMGRDITEQYLADAALRESERRFSALARQLPVGVFEADAEGNLTFGNERMQRLTGRTQEQLAGNGWLMSVHPVDRAGFVRDWRAALVAGGSLSQEVRLAGARGVVVWVACRIAPMRDGNGRTVGYLGSLDDISERKQAEALREDVEAVVRHDLKSPLGGLQSALELLGLLGPLNSEQQQVCGEARALLRRMLGLITLSLDLAAIEAGRYTPRPEEVDPVQVLESLRRELRPLLSAKALALEVSGAEEGELLVLGERRLLDNALANLLKNAAEAAPEGGGIGVRLVREPDGSHADLIIRNPGEVPQDMRARFFEKYATSGKSGGTGLGTYSALLLVRTMGGTLTLNTEEPGHTTITVRLPLVPARPTSGS